MAKDIESLLTSIGLLPSEAKIYLATLSRGSETVQNIAKQAKVSRTAAYEAIESLQQRGLMSSTLSGKKRLYSAEDPDRIVSYLKEEKSRLETKIDDVGRSLDSLRLLAGGTKPVVRTFEGKEAVFAYFDVLSRLKSDRFDEIANLDEVYKAFDSEILMKARKTYKIEKKKGRLLYRGKLQNPRANMEYRTLHESFGPFHGNIAMFGKTIVFVSFEGAVTTVVMESEEFSRSMKTLFESAWRASK